MRVNELLVTSRGEKEKATFVKKVQTCVFRRCDSCDLTRLLYRCVYRDTRVSPFILESNWTLNFEHHFSYS